MHAHGDEWAAHETRRTDCHSQTAACIATCHLRRADSLALRLLRVCSAAILGQVLGVRRRCEAGAVDRLDAEAFRALSAVVPGEGIGVHAGHCLRHVDVSVLVLGCRLLSPKEIPKAITSRSPLALRKI